MINVQIVHKGLAKESIAREETIFHAANGYVGVRGCLEEKVPDGVTTIRGTYLNGYYDKKPICYGERLYGFPQTQEGIVNVVDVQSIRLRLGEEWLDPFSGEVLEHVRTLDMEAGFTVRLLHWRSPMGKEIILTVRRMASFALRELFTLRYEVASVNYEGPISIISTQNADVRNFADPNDPRMAAQAHQHLTVESMTRDGETDLITCRTKASRLMMASAVCHRTGDGFHISQCQNPSSLETILKTRLSPGMRAEVVKWCIFTDQRRYEDPAKAALHLMEKALRQPLQAWEDKQREYLSAFWETSRVLVAGDSRLQDSIDFSVYQLLQSAGRDDISNVAAKGLSGEGYEGHYFWDTEIYIFPFFLLTDRDAAKGLLCYRHGILSSARAQARLLGHQKGALYSWRTISGPECSSYYPSGSAQYHINGDVAHSFIQYYLATGDLQFMAQKGAEVLVETARLWLDAGHMQEGMFRIDCVTGPDEYTCIVNNNYYTNASAKENLRYAAMICDALDKEGMAGQVQKATGVTKEELQAFLTAAEHMYLPYDEKLGIPPQDDTFLNKKPLDLAALPKTDFPLLLNYHPLFLYRHQVCKQADTVLAHYLFEDLADEDTIRRSFAYYEKITTHDSSLSACVFSIMAARLNDMEKALQYFLKTAFMDLEDAHGNTRDGLHTANLGGTYLGIVAGFGGLRIREDGLLLRPRLPSGWKSYQFRFQYRDSLLEVQVLPGICRIALLKGQPVSLLVHRERVLVQGEVTVAFS